LLEKEKIKRNRLQLKRDKKNKFVFVATKVEAYLEETES